MGDGFQTQKRKPWIPGQVRAQKVLADAIAIDGREGVDLQVLFRNQCLDAGGDADDATPTSLPGCRRKYRQATSAKTRRWSSGVILEWWRRKKPRDQDAEITELRAQVEQLRSQQRVEKGQCKVIR